MRHRVWVLAALLLLWLSAAPAGAARIVVFGDSWGVTAAPALQQVLSDEGLPDTVAGAATPGETAADLSKPSGLQHITDTLAAHPDADLVHLSIGGNDFLGQWSSSLPPAQQAALFVEILGDVETIVDHILAVRPGVEILWSSYDFARPLPAGTPAEVNAASLAFGGQADAFADAKGPGVSYGEFNGLMQVEFGFDGVQHTPFDPPFPIPPGDPSLPDPTLPSPDAAFSDAIHLTAEGYQILAEAHFDAFYAARLQGEAAPVPALGWPMQGLLAGLLLAAGAGRRRE